MLTLEHKFRASKKVKKRSELAVRRRTTTKAQEGLERATKMLIEDLNSTGLGKQDQLTQPLSQNHKARNVPPQVIQVTQGSING